MLNRCEIENRDLSLASAAGAAVAPLDARGRRVALEQCVFGLGVKRGGGFVEHEQERMIAHEAARERQLLPLAETHFDAARPGRTELRFEAGIQMLDHVIGARASDRGNHGGLVVESRDVAEAHSVARAKLEAKKILERARDVLAPIVSGNPRQVNAIYQDATLRRADRGAPAA